METKWENFTDEELLVGARSAQAYGDTLPLTLAEPLQSVAAMMLTELARRRLARRTEAA